jgi:pSer/pThr/pTyr-binding forkhead associated (FHA) protein
MTQSPLARHSATPAELKERIEAERRGRAFLVYRDGAGGQRIFQLESELERITVGRRAANHIPLGWDLGVSRVHAELVRIGDSWTLTDDGLSRNGSLVNGERLVGRRRLRDGDVLSFGGTAIAFCDPETGKSRTTVDEAETPLAASVSPAQRRVLLALCRPYAAGASFAAPASNKDIADELCVGVDAVKTHMRALFSIFGVGHLPQNQKRARLAERAFRTGVVTERDL